MTTAAASTAATTAAATQKIDSARTSLATNFQTFLALLTAQLKNQDPLSPLDSNAFTQQLTQMSGVEQQLLTNDLLKSLVSQSKSGLSGAVEYIGKTVTAAVSTTKLQGGSATWSYELAADAATATIEIKDSSGAVVWKGPAPSTGAGVHDFSWDGKTLTGVKKPDGGAYTMTVTATTAAGRSVDAQTLIRGKATGVEVYDGSPYLTIGGAYASLDSVISVQSASSP